MSSRSRERGAGHHVGVRTGTFELQVTVLDKAHRLGATHQRQHPDRETVACW